MQEKYLALGFMSGTSLDGVDAALIRTDGRDHVEPVAQAFVAYEPHERALLQQALVDARGMMNRAERPGVLAEAEAMIHKVHLKAAFDLLDAQKMTADMVDVVGFHGQTVWHDPAAGVTVQIGDGVGLAKALQNRVVYDLRAADMAAGGQGAPFVPVYHRALARMAKLEGVTVFINIGGIANISWIGADGSLLAFDTGPGNALMNDYMMQTFEKPYDEDGALAQSGQVDLDALTLLLMHDYFQKKPPKSLDRNAFSLEAVAKLAPEDAMATLAAFTVETIVMGLRDWCLDMPDHLVVCGGGAQNQAILDSLRQACLGSVHVAEDFGYQSGYIEAEAFAYLAVRHLKGEPLTFPGTTGVAEPLPGGVLAKPN